MLFGSTTIHNAGNSEAFYAKYDSAGNLLWVKSFGSTGQEIANSIAHDESVNIYITGNHSSSNLSLGNSTLNNINSSFNLFLAKADSSGGSVWAKGIGQYNLS